MRRPRVLHSFAQLRLSTKLTLLVTLFTVLASTVTVCSSLGVFVREFKAGVAADQSGRAQAMAGELDDKILVAQRALLAVAQGITPQMAADRQALQRFLASRTDLLQFFVESTFLSPNGVVLASAPLHPPLIGRDLSFRPYFRATVAERRPCISEPFLAVVPERAAVVFTAPVFDAGHRIAGVLLGRIDLPGENFLGRLSRNVRAPGEFFLFNRRGQVIVHRDRSRLLTEPAGEGEPIFRRAAAGLQGSVETVDRSGRPVLASCSALRSTGWIVAVQVPLSELYRPFRNARFMVLCALPLVLPLVLWLLSLCARRLVAPVVQLAEGVNGVNGAHTEYAQMPVTTDDEIGGLTKAFNRLMQEVSQQRRALEEEKGFSEQLLFNTAVPSFVIDANLRVIIWNRACEELTGVAAQDVVGGPDGWRAFYPTKRSLLAEVVVRGNLWEMADLYDRYSESPLLRDGLRTEGWFQLKGKAHYLSVDAAPIRDSSGAVIAAIETLQDVTQRKRKEEELQRVVAAIAESEERYRRLVELSLDGIALLVGRLFVYVNSAGCDILGAATPDVLVGGALADFVERDSLELFEEQLRYVEENCQSSPWLEQRLVRSDRSTVDVELGVSPFVFEGREALQVIFRDITERKLAKARLETLAHYDSLTSLPNRVLFFDRLSHVVEESKRHDYPLALLFLDLDGFKEVNDTLGHDAGDVVLVAVGQRLKECVRSCDMVARMGGDEFTVILSKLAAEDDAALVAERILEALSRPFEVCGQSRTVGGSIGICLYPSGARDVEELVSHADTAMYQVKQSGANGYCYYGAAPVHRGAERAKKRPHPHRPPPRAEVGEVSAEIGAAS